MISDIVVLFGASFVISILLVPFLRTWARKKDLMDKADGNPLKVHQGSIPKIGGLGLIIATGLALYTQSFLHSPVPVIFRVLFAGSLGAFGLGCWVDFRKEIEQIPRITICSALGILVFIFGIRVEFIPVFGISLFLTVFYVAGAVFAVNMQDGLDGLASGLVAISCIGFAVISLNKVMPLTLFISLALFGALLGFLIYNFTPASIFMGDNGSYFLGFALAFLAISLTNKPYGWSNFIGPILIIGFPVVETAFSILRRVRTGKSPFAGDRNHFYDQLMQKGLSVRQTVMICWGIQAVFVGMGIGIYLID